MKYSLLILTLATLVLSGCRREDIREFTVEIPGLTEANKAQVMDALKLADQSNPGRLRYTDGVLPETFVFDFDRKTLTLKYDSMKIAKTNIRMMIQEKGIEVAFPTNTTGKAGYIDSH